MSECESRDSVYGTVHCRCLLPLARVCITYFLDKSTGTLYTKALRLFKNISRVEFLFLLQVVARCVFMGVLGNRSKLVSAKHAGFRGTGTSGMLQAGRKDLTFFIVPLEPRKVATIRPFHSQARVGVMSFTT